MLQKPQSLWEWGNIQVMGLKCSKRHLYTHLFSGVWDLNTTFKRCHKALPSTDKTMPCDCLWEHQDAGQWKRWAQAFRLRFGRQNVAFPSSAIPRWGYEVRCFGHGHVGFVWDQHLQLKQCANVFLWLPRHLELSNLTKLLPFPRPPPCELRESGDQLRLPGLAGHQGAALCDDRRAWRRLAIQTQATDHVLQCRPSGLPFLQEKQKKWRQVNYIYTEPVNTSEVQNTLLKIS